MTILVKIWFTTNLPIEWPSYLANQTHPVAQFGQPNQLAKCVPYTGTPISLSLISALPILSLDSSRASVPTNALPTIRKAAERVCHPLLLPPSPRGNLLPSKNRSPHPSFHCHDALSLSRLAAIANHAEACHSTHSLLFPCHCRSSKRDPWDGGVISSQQRESRPTTTLVSQGWRLLPAQLQRRCRQPKGKRKSLSLLFSMLPTSLSPVLTTSGHPAGVGGNVGLLAVVGGDQGGERRGCTQKESKKEIEVDI